MRRPCHQNSIPSWTNPLVKQGNIHLSFQKRWRKEHICISLDTTLDGLFGSNNANSRCSFPLIKKLKPDGFFFFLTYSEQRPCAKSTRECCRFQHTKQGRKKSWMLLPCYFSQVFVRGKGGMGEWKERHWRVSLEIMRSQTPPAGREGTLVQS